MFSTLKDYGFNDFVIWVETLYDKIQSYLI
jgi:NDP-sugar pyrophosphorylase family protein